jgi:predicted dehydrogenase
MALNRRRFLGSSAVGLATGAAAFAIGRSAGAQASDLIRYGLIGVGGRGTGLASIFNRRPDVHCAWLCDPDLRRAGGRAKRLTTPDRKPPTPVQDFRRALDDENLDAVIVATPDHWHALATVLACQAGKDVYVEKPASYSIWEGRQMVTAARKFKRVVQVGIQNRSARYIHRAIDHIGSGALGSIPLIRVCNLKSGGPFRKADNAQPPDQVDYDRWLGPAPKRAFNPRRFHGSWYYLWDFCGGDMGNDASHQLDIARWLIGKDAPTCVSAHGGNLAFDDDREVPDTQTATFDFNGTLMIFELTQYARYMDKTPGSIRDSDQFPRWLQNATRIEVYGTKQLMVLGRHGGGWQVFTRGGKVAAQEYGRQAHSEHLGNWADCIRSRKLSHADILQGHLSANLSHLGNIATRLGGTHLDFDPEAERFTNNDAANEFLKRDHREPYVFPALG